MKTLILDYSKWRSGDNADKKTCRVGRGATFLRNKEGYMCCLGQFAPQLEPEITKKDLNCKAMPSDLDIFIPLFMKIPSGNQETEFKYLDTKLANKAACINDDENTTIEDKIVSLRALFLEAGFKIRVINRPK